MGVTINGFWIATAFSELFGITRDYTSQTTVTQPSVLSLLQSLLAND
jgi:hypothetical protein